MHTELEEFSRCWEHQTGGAIALMRALPVDQYDFRPDAGGLQEVAFFSWFFGNPSLGIYGGDSNNGTFPTDAGPPCQ